ncbi:MAG: hypothetical protein AAF728_20490 [Cyanobacteria bacterium P01_D01_bin.128]
MNAIANNPSSHPETWGLSPQTVNVLAQSPEILPDLARSRTLPPLPPGYVPQVVEVLFDDVPFIRSEGGNAIFLRDCRAAYEPTLIEYRFDDETAVFQVGSEYVVNRIEGIAQVTALTSVLN